MDLGRRIAALRVERGLTQRELAHQAELSPATIAHWETNEKCPTPKNRAKLAAVLGVDPRDLMPDYEIIPERRVVITEPELISFVGHYRRLSPQARQAMLQAVQLIAKIPGLQAETT